MADRYWVGGTASWDGTAGTKWSATSGGPGGASVPTTADAVFFNASSGAGTVTIATGNTGALSINCTGFTGTLTGTAAITVAGNITLVAGMTYTHTGTVTITGTGTLTTAGKTFGTLVINGSGITVTLGSALNTSTRDVTVTAGTLTTSASNYSITCRFLSFGAGGTLTLNGSTVNCTTISSAAGTLNAGTSQINCTPNTNQITFEGGGKTFYNVTLSQFDAATINGANTFNNLTFKMNSSAGAGGWALEIIYSANQIINGTLSTDLNLVSGPTFRWFFRSSVFGTARTLTIATNAIVNTDFRDITIAGVASPLTGTSYANCGGNSGITFTAAKTVYWSSTGSSYFSDGWATSSGGSASTNNMPLAQDTLIFDNAGAGGTIDCYSHNVGTVNITRTNAITLNFYGVAGGAPFSFSVYGDWTTGTATTLTFISGSPPYILFAGAVAQTITANGVTWNVGIGIQSRNTVTLADNLTISLARAGVVSLIDGTLNLNGKTLTLSASTTATFATVAGTKNLTFNGGTLSIASSSTTAFNNAAPTGFTTTAGTGTGTISLTSASGKTFVGGGSTYNCTLNQGGAGGLTITGSNTFNDITNTRKTVSATQIIFTAGTTTTVSDFTAAGEAGRVLTIQSTSAGSAATLSKASGTVSVDYLSIRDSTATGGAGWYAGANSTNVSNNTGWIFTAPPPVVVSGNFLMFF